MVMTNSLDYFKVIKASYDNAGLPVPASLTAIWGDPNNPSVAPFTYAEPGAIVSKNVWGQITAVDASQYSYPNGLIETGSPGTNWWKAVWGSAPVQDFNVDVRGGSDVNAYTVSGNYFDQKGTAAYTDYRRGSLRANTSFNRGKFNFGENAVLTLSRQYGGTGTFDDTNGEGGVLGKDILTQPIISVFDVAGNFAGGRGVPGVNNTNPLQVAWSQKDNITKFNSTFGNVFASYDIMPALTFKTNLGFDLRQNSEAGFNDITPQNNEANFTNSIF